MTTLAEQMKEAIQAQRTLHSWCERLAMMAAEPYKSDPEIQAETTSAELDALSVGAQTGALYALTALRSLGLLTVEELKLAIATDPTTIEAVSVLGDVKEQ